ncbi:hypothetical protein OROHE_000379 [Orobanche hederae]
MVLSDESPGVLGLVLLELMVSRVEVIGKGHVGSLIRGPMIPLSEYPIYVSIYVNMFLSLSSMLGDVIDSRIWVAPYERPSLGYLVGNLAQKLSKQILLQRPLPVQLGKQTYKYQTLIIATGRSVFRFLD